MTDFDTHRLETDRPSPERIHELYRELPRRGCVTVTVGVASLQESLVALETAGFFGLMVSCPAPSWQTVQVTAYKGKAGPCYDTGKVAALTGPEIVALDDDNHLIFGQIAVCEKTATIYELPVYAPFIKVSEGKPDLLDRLVDDPVAFDCDTFQDDVDRLSAYADWTPATDDPLVTVIYRGPFKQVICKDGSLVRRGQPLKLPKPIITEFAPTDSLLTCPDTLFQAERAPLFQNEFAKAGSICLLGQELEFHRSEPNGPVRMDALETCSDAMIIRLLGMIERGDTHVILTGSDPNDEFGCCPSADVGEAMRLVEAGILEAYRLPAPQDACTSTVFTFPDERADTGEFTVNTEFRQCVKDHVYSVRREGNGRPKWKQVLTILLLIFVGVALVYASREVFHSFLDGSAVGDTSGLVTFAAELGLDDGVTVVVIRKNDSCESCLRAIALCKETLDSLHSDLADSGEVRQKNVTLDDTRRSRLFKRYGLADTLSVLVITVSNGREQSVTDLTAAFWDARYEPEQFKSRLVKVIQNHAEAAL